ncbi:MAG: DUF2892 domain-containing protein [Pirellulales bacterium]
MIASTANRVPENTADEVNAEIRRQTEQNIARYARAGRGAIFRRLDELDREWDVERALETLAPSFTLAGLLLGTTANRKWLLLPIAVNAFLLMHALQGWCPPMPVLRRMGFRTAGEIEVERRALENVLAVS